MPPLRSAKRQTLNEKIIKNHDKEINSVEALPRMIDKLSIDENAKQNIVSELNQDSTAREEITERDSKLTASLYDVDEMSFEELQASLCRITENPQQPFSFLANISDEFANDKQLSTEPTEIDVKELFKL